MESQQQIFFPRSNRSYRPYQCMYIQLNCVLQLFTPVRVLTETEKHRKTYQSNSPHFTVLVLNTISAASVLQYSETLSINK